MRAQFEPNGTVNSNDFVVETYETPYSVTATTAERLDFEAFKTTDFWKKTWFESGV